MKKKFLLISAAALFVSACNSSGNKKNADDDSRYIPKPYVELKHPEWSKNATIYEVNVRQYTTGGTFNAFEKNLPRLKEMGIDIIWLMPIYPIGVKNRKGTLGSKYSVNDYYAINPEYSTMDDFKSPVKKFMPNILQAITRNSLATNNMLLKEIMSLHYRHGNIWC